MLKFVEDLLQGAPVEWKTLGEVMVRTKGIPITASQMRLLNRCDGAVKVFAGGKTIAYLAYEDLPLQDVHFTPSIIVKSRGIVEFEYYDKAFSHKNELWSYHSTSETVDTKFVYYFLKTKETLLRTKAAIMGAMPQISIPDTENILIPIPPFPVQEKIVTVLDKFTDLERELETKLGTELVLRKKQYEYYRNKLLTFGEEVEWKKLGEVMVRTKGIPITASQMRLLNRSDGAVKVFAGGKTVAYLAYEDLPLQDVHFTPSIIVKSRGIVEFEYYDKAFSHKNELWSYHSKSETVDTKFVYYFLKTKETLLRTKAAIMGAMPQISIPDTENILIPIPPLPVQEKIVFILDKFDTLANSLTEGLPREIALRHKQYEYYRDQLLTFPKA